MMCTSIMRRQLFVLVGLLACTFPITGAIATPPEAPTAPHVSSSSSPALSASAPLKTSVASSTEVPQLVVWLKSGGVTRGSVVEFVPDSHVVLQLITGEGRRIPWSQVKRFRWIDGAAAPTEPRPSASTASPLKSKKKQTWRLVCDAPCGTTVDVHRQSLRISGPDTSLSNSFHIEGEGEETLEVSAGSSTLNRWGERSLIMGIGLALAGGLVFGLGRVEDEAVAEVGGAVAMGLGGLGVIVAFPLLGTSATIVRNGQGERVGRVGMGERRF